MHTQQQQRGFAKIAHPLAGNGVSDADRQAFDHLDVLICSREDLLTLYESIDSAQVRAFIVGILDTREHMAVITGREF